jgi:hypothetical protein
VSPRRAKPPYDRWRDASGVHAPDGCRVEQVEVDAPHRALRSCVQSATRHRTVEVVDARTLTAHFMALNALAAGRLPQAPYVTRCGQDVLPASLVEPGRRRCPSCAPLPSQRSRPS